MRVFAGLCALGGTLLTGSSDPRVLFIGNSYTYFNNLPAMVSALGRASGHPIETTMIVRGGATLDVHWNNESAVAAIRRGGWTHVVLQEQSQLGNMVFINGATPIVDDGGFLAAARRFDEVIREQRARTVLFRHWSRRSADPADRIRLATAFDQVEDSLSTLAAPVAAAWDSARRRLPNLDLYIQDGSHPTAAGSYLAALVFYATLTGRSPVGLPRRLTGPAVDDAGAPGNEKNAMLVDLDELSAAKLQQIALEVTRAGSRRARASGALPPLPKPPEVPAGAAPSLTSLMGDWSGRATIAPFPTRLEISVKPGSAAPSISATLVAGPNRIGGAATTLSFERGRMVFTQSNGLQGLPMRFEGVIVGDSLTGVVRIDGDAARFHAVGTWAVAKHKQ